MNIDILVTGVHEEATSSSNCTVLRPHTGAVTFIEHVQKKILVDVGGMGTFEEIQEKLAQKKMIPSDIDFIVLTHFHLDHSFNVSQFSNARVFGWNHEWRNRETVRYHSIQSEEMIPGIRVIPTPGHAEEHISVFLPESPYGKLVISGDAINEKYVQTKEVSAFSYNTDLYRESAEKILSLAETIIPGHGPMMQSPF